MPKTNSFKQYFGDLIGLPTNKNHLNYRWDEPNCKVLFSITKHGGAASCHVACDKSGIFKIKRAINDFADFVFNAFDWCDMIIVKNYLKKFEPILERCEFRVAARDPENNNKSIYVREKPWVS